MNPATTVELRRTLPLQEGVKSLAPWLGFPMVALQCAAVLVLIDRFRLENHFFRLITALALCGFLVHHVLPLRARLPFFLALSLGIITFCLGIVEGQWQLLTSLERTGTLVAVGLALIGICHLPLRFRWRVLLLLLAGGVLACYRTGVARLPLLDDLWTILGGMFMFRLMVYLYDLDTQKERPPLVRSLSYFFLFPNLWLFLFPIVDFRLFSKNYFNDQPLAIYQKGVQWMMRGVIHLLIWRLFYYNFYIDPANISNGSELFQFVFSNIMLYLRVTGQFHFAIGLLHLFGFNLPETNRRLFLASSFTDYWRRANIYWKDFIVKIFYYPAIVRLKSWGTTWSVVGATAIAFLMTWLLHAYQWFWLRGSFPLPVKDLIFWGALGTLVCVNSLVEMRHGRSRALNAQSLTWDKALRRALATGATFTVITILWSIWTCDSIEQWIGIWTLADRFTLLYGGCLVLTIMAAALWDFFSWDPFRLNAKPAAKGLAARAQNFPRPLAWRQALAFCLIPAAGLYAVSSYRVMSYYPPDLKEMTRSLSRNTPNRSGEEFLVRGYYENLMDAGRLRSILNEDFSGQPASWRLLEETPLSRPVANLRTRDLVPSMEMEVNGKRIRTNQWAMRDQDYTLEKPAGVYRIALLGSSLVMGWNVQQEEVFETLVEDRLNRELAPARFEILNFGVNGFSVVSAWEALREKALAFKPDAVLLVAHPEDPPRAHMIFARSLTMGVVPPDPYLEQIRVATGITEETPRPQAERELAPYPMDLVRWAYREIAALCRGNGIEPVYVYLPGVLTQGAEERGDKLLPVAREAGFQIISLSGLYASIEDRSTLMVAPWDAHPNALGHQIIANRLFQEIQNLTRKK